MLGFYPVLMSDDLASATQFYVGALEFEITFASDWYVSLRRESYELALLDPSHPTIPERYRGVAARGVLLNLEVENVDAVHADLLARGARVVLPLRSEEFGQRHVIVAGPDQVLVDVITPIPPVGDYVAQYVDQVAAPTRRS